MALLLALLSLLAAACPEAASSRAERQEGMTSMTGSHETEGRLKAHLVIHFTPKFVGRLSKTTTLRLRTL
jgi:hypothetical protein